MTATISRPPLSDRLASSKVIAVLRAPHVAALAPVCDVLVEEGILGIELTLTTPDLLGALSDLVDRYTATADVGVGTILTELDAQRAIDSGAQFLVTPTMNLPVIKLAVQRQIAVFPGGLTPTELAAGWDAGATAVKIFPAQTVGAGYLKHLRGPFPDLQAVPSGGVDLDASRQWLAAGAVAVSIGGPLLGDALNGGDLSALRDRCGAVRAVVAETVLS
ncbi:MAG TPA: bifunctional 4-hydroxy-2-oxoglutarate aldolase/2-dehydro-3-deoxy-phosphogluconate aldolase [Propionibacteriaceae bacterium]|jgi:2-dehydro-3-deoxyphosphogluconate aldolase/(4S)-4-hydroxy-2-oxoglutarate aldolase|nr:bifunctional 4-hydroxy-2-oxoglutarate aldolase/2-dehydro-3-deoxy-phosphogluconate aldolase [Propionibacteriaceae bacterium]